MSIFEIITTIYSVGSVLAPTVINNRPINPKLKTFINGQALVVLAICMVISFLSVNLWLINHIPNVFALGLIIIYTWISFGLCILAVFSYHGKHFIVNTMLKSKLTTAIIFIMTFSYLILVGLSIFN